MRRLLLICLFLLALPAHAGNAPQPPDGILAEPKYEALRFGKVKMHTGPGQQYPVSWIYQRKALPVKIVATYDVWRKIVDPEGTSGWVQETMLAEKRTVVVAGARRTLRQDPEATAATIALADPGAIAVVQSCASNWCRLKFHDYEGWMRETELWGTASGESFETKK